MAFTINFQTSNAAFDDGADIEEIGKILIKIRDDLDYGSNVGIIGDTNGNRIGDWEYIKD